MSLILIVDDNEQNIYMLEVLLKSHGHEVISAPNGEKALEAARERLPDLAVTDILMPVMDGFSLCRRWKSDPQLQSKPFVFYTATYTDPRDEAFGLSLGAERFLLKPLEPERLLQVIEELLAPGEVQAEDSLAQEESEFLKEYNIALFRKLEKKMSDLREANNILRRNMESHRKLEEQLLQAKKLESIGQFASGIAHDFNNLLMAISGSASLIQMETEKAHPHHDLAGQILNAVRIGSEMSRQLLAFARRQELKLLPIDLNEALTQSLPTVRSLLPSGITLEFHAGAPLPTISADRAQILQVLMNLASNARDAMPEGGLILLDTQAFHLDEDFVRQKADGEAGHYVRFRMIDQGTGMEEGVLEKIFDPFFTTKEMGKGTGLGLAVVYGIVRQHGGFVQVSSIPGKGTCFEVYLPSSEK